MVDIVVKLCHANNECIHYGINSMVRLVMVKKWLNLRGLPRAHTHRHTKVYAHCLPARSFLGVRLGIHIVLSNYTICVSRKWISTRKCSFSLFHSISLWVGPKLDLK